MKYNNKLAHNNVYIKREFTYGMFSTYPKNSYIAYITPNHYYLLKLE